MLLVSRTAVDANDYTLAGRTITFKPGKEPSADSKIIASYRTGVQPKINNFTLAATPAPGTLTVKIDNVATTKYTLAGKVVSFDVQPPAGRRPHVRLPRRC